MEFKGLFLPKKKNHLYIFFAIITILTVIVSFGMVNLETNNDVSVMLPTNIETAYEREKIARLGKEFPSEQLLFIAVSDDPFSVSHISKLWNLCRDIEKLNVVKSTLTPFNSMYFKKLGNSSFTIGKTRMSSDPTNDKAIDEFKEHLHFKQIPGRLRHIL